MNYNTLCLFFYKENSYLLQESKIENKSMKITDIFFKPHKALDLILKPQETLDMIFKPAEKSIDLIFQATDEITDEYRVILNLRYINELINLEVVEESENLESFAVDARKGKIYLTGNYKVGAYYFARLFKIHSVDFRVELTPIWVKNNHVRFRITNYRISNPESKKFDLVKILSFIDFYHKNYILTQIVEDFPRMLSLTKLKQEIRLSLNYFLDKASISANIHIKKIFADKHKVVFIVHSGILIKSLMDFFGSDIVQVEPLRNSSEPFFPELGDNWLL